MKTYLSTLILCLAYAIFLTGCGQQQEVKVTSTSEQIEEKKIPDYYHTNQKFVPEASGIKIQENEDVLYDVSNTNQGYMMVKKKTDDEKMLVQVIGNDGITYNYYIKEKDRYFTIPLTAGDGEYQVTTYLNVGENEYVMSFSEIVCVSLENEVIPFLYPSQYVNFDDSMNAIALAKELTKNEEQMDAISSVYNYVIEKIRYDYDKADTVESGYLPVIDRTLEEKKGICFDYAALMTAMLRSQGIPTRLDIGYNVDVYHAWISVYLKEKGWVNNILEFDGENWNLVDPTMASALQEAGDTYTANQEDYTLEYTH